MSSTSRADQTPPRGRWLQESFTCVVRAAASASPETIRWYASNQGPLLEQIASVIAACSGGGRQTRRYVPPSPDDNDHADEDTNRKDRNNEQHDYAETARYTTAEPWSRDCHCSRTSLLVGHRVADHERHCVCARCLIGIARLRGRTDAPIAEGPRIGVRRQPSRDSARERHGEGSLAVVRIRRNRNLQWRDLQDTD